MTSGACNWRGRCHESAVDYLFRTNPAATVVQCCIWDGNADRFLPHTWIEEKRKGRWWVTDRALGALTGRVLEMPRRDYDSALMVRRKTCRRYDLKGVVRQVFQLKKGYAPWEIDPLCRTGPGKTP
mgnify:CR=1 FL=1